MASLNFNKVFLAGKLTAEPELRTTASGKYVINFSIGVTVGKDKTTDKYKADFFDIVAWDNKAEFISKYFHKGSTIFIEGILQNRTWNDNSGNRRRTTEVIVYDARFVDSRNEVPGIQQEAAAYVPSSYTVPAEGPAPAPKMEEVDEGDDLPF